MSLRHPLIYSTTISIGDDDSNSKFVDTGGWWVTPEIAATAHQHDIVASSYPSLAKSHDNIVAATYLKNIELSNIVLSTSQTKHSGMFELIIDEALSL